MTNHIGMPPAQGLYDPANEHDSCGVGFVANIKGRKSHSIVKRGIEILCNLTHRGAVGADPLDGDGAGLMIQLPDAYHREVCNFSLPPLGEYGTGLVFLPQGEARREACIAALEGELVRTGCPLLGWRDVCTDGSTIGRNARSVEPKVMQIFVGRGEIKASQLELMLYLGRKRAENVIRTAKLAGEELFYVCSLSTRTILYKGMLLSEQLNTFFPELDDERLVSALAFVHQRYSTNTFPTWDLAHPFRYVAHNGEINTLRGNINRMKARTALFAHLDLADGISDLDPVVIEGSSDTACFDNALELLVVTGRSLAHSLAMMVPEAWASKAHLRPELKGFYEYHATMMEPWDGPANLVACDGRQIVAILDRNGLRPARYWLTSDDEIIYASEAGVLDVPPEKILRKERLAPGKMILVDVETGEFKEDHEIKGDLAAAQPYASWVRDHLIRLEDLPAPATKRGSSPGELRRVQGSFGYTLEEMRVVMAPMAMYGQEPVGSMGTDTPIAVLSKRSKLIYWYFSQLFAQVTNPSIDPLREELVMSLTQYIGPARNILMPGPEHCCMLELENPIITNDVLEQLRHSDLQNFQGTTVSTLFEAWRGPDALENRLENLFVEVEAAVDAGCTILVLSDRGVCAQKAPIPALLALSAIHHHLIRAGKRSQCSLIIETGEAREVHHFALLLGYGATAINPYLAFEILQDMVHDGSLPGLDGNDRADEEHDIVYQYSTNYIKAIGKGLLKVFSKMGISTLQSYCSAQIFEIIGLDQSFTDKYFPGTACRIGGAGLKEIATESLMRHGIAYAEQPDINRDLERGAEYSWRRDGEIHLMNPEVIALLQHAVRSGNRDVFKQYAHMVNDQSERLCTLRGLFKFKGQSAAVPLDEVEPVSAIVKRFCTGAMSLGSISPEAHEILAIAMNRLGGKSNTGEGGEDPRRYTPDVNGDQRRSAIKQVASGRFGVTPHYLVNADELQIKIAQGAKPGEGGQLPGHKVSEYIGSLRYSVPGVTLISPPPHHDIYSIEDLAQLIFDLKNCNPKADITVKLVSEVGVGTVAAGVSKGRAERVVIAGYDGGTGASPTSSIKHAGIPWEIGLAETQQTLVLNDLRGRIIVQTDGQLRTGRDVVVAAILGAEEYAFATVALVTLGCIMMRKCHLNTCPVGVATQDKSLRAKFNGKAEHVINYFTFLAEEVRELLAELGVRSLDELIGQTQYLEMDDAIKHWKNQGLDFSRMLAKPEVGPEVATRRIQGQDHGLEKQLDNQLLKLAAPALERKEAVHIEMPIRNSNRTFATMLSGQIAMLHGREGLPKGTINLTLNGIAGQSFGAFLAPGIDLHLIGEANDYVGKGMAGGRIIIRPDPKAVFAWDENSIVGNTVLYGATGGEAYFAGKAGERFCVRNSGVIAVVEGVGDHGCEYMTAGRMICLGRTGRNFAAGMSGGFAYVLDLDNRFRRRCNSATVDLELMSTDDYDAKWLQQVISRHHEMTGSPRAKKILATWDEHLTRFVRVFPHEYRRALSERAAKAEQKETLNG
ncbi:glutamate synthase large subunit [Geopsychrobacter electrodiphilus]|uniref:glutamate synthase large subunit n=1 Tax=Geopsychrobacter electrodiphilus TaxID=225196 RepID=UPI0003644802|nr:glutamate synthase large subunit [Geopsychrobacter electrodiphilus]